MLSKSSLLVHIHTPVYSGCCSYRLLSKHSNLLSLSGLDMCWQPCRTFSPPIFISSATQMFKNMPDEITHSLVHNHYFIFTLSLPELIWWLPLVYILCLFYAYKISYILCTIRPQTSTWPRKHSAIM